MELVPQDQERELSIFDDDNPDSVIRRMPQRLVKYLHKVDYSLLEMPETALRKKVKPDPTLNKLRIAFWEEHDKACATKKKMTLSGITRGNCTTNTLENGFFGDPLKIAWILCPVSEYREIVVEALEASMAKLREMIDHITFLDGQGKFDPRQAKLALQLTEMLQNRALGAVTQKTLNQNLNVNQNSTNVPPLDMDGLSEAEAKKELKRMKDQIAKNKSRTIATEARHVEKEDPKYSTIKPILEPDPGGHQQDSLTRSEGEGNGRGVDGTF